MSTIERAAKALITGKLVAFPTETVYGLGADASNETAVGRIFEVKNRPKNHPLIVHIANVSDVDFWASEFPDYAKRLAEKFWPGPMTLILPRSENAKDFITGAQESVGLRIPKHPVAQELLQAFSNLGGKGVAAPSANRFGQLSPTDAAAVKVELGESLGSEDIILDGGLSDVGIESTIIDCTGTNPAVLRAGFVSPQQIEQVTGLEVVESTSGVRVSGALKRHYSPRTPLQLGGEAKAGEGLIALASYPTPTGVVRLATPSNIEEFAHLLYQSLRKADELGLLKVVVIPPQGDHLADAILDRLTKAAAK
jgi:L-threonylcarbamoyladenylate synthase